MPEALTLYKLMILFLLKHADFSLSNGQLTEFILGRGYTDYIVFSETLGELTEADLISSVKHAGRTDYSLTDKGNTTIGFFEDRIPASIREDIRAFLKEKRCDIKNELAVTADWYKTTNHDYAVLCRIREGNGYLIELTVTVPTEVQAEATAIKWKSKYQELYAHIMQELL